MGIWYKLVNFTKRERVSLAGVSGMKASEIVWNPEGGTLAAFYMLKNIGDDISFVPDDAPFRGALEVDLSGFNDVAEKYIDELVTDGVLVDVGIDPDSKKRIVRHWVFVRPNDPLAGKTCSNLVGYRPLKIHKTSDGT